MQLFDIIGILPPYRVELFEFGTVELDKLSDEQAEQVWRNGCPFLTPNEKGRRKFFPEQKPITVEKLSTTKSKPVAL